MIGILAGLVIVAYNGISIKASLSGLQSGLSQAATKLEIYKVSNNDSYPTTLASAGFAAPAGSTYVFNASTTGYCLSGTLAGSSSGTPSATSYYVTNTTNVPASGTCSGVFSNGTTCPTGFIVVPGNATFGTSDFCVMKYGASNVSGVASSVAGNSPWTNITQTSAITTAAAACASCHLITDVEWETIATNVMSVGTNAYGQPSNWSGGAVGSGYMYSGHNDNAPANKLATNTNDASGYSGETNTGGNQRRTLALTNGEVIWDLAGNVDEWTTGTIAGNAQPGFASEVTNTSKDYNNGSLIQNGLLSSAYPSYGTPAANGWTFTQGIGRLSSNYGQSGARSFERGGYWLAGSSAGVYSLNMGDASFISSSTVGFRVSR